MKPYLDEDGRLEVLDDKLLSGGSYPPEDESFLMHPGGSLEERYQIYHDMAIQCNEDPVSFDEWLNA